MIELIVDPTDRCRAFVVFADGANELARESPYGSEDASRDNIALNLGKPNFDQVDPAGVGRGRVDPNSGVGLKEFRDFLSPVCSQVVRNDVDLVTCRLTHHDPCEEIDEVRAGWAFAGFSKHSPL